MKKIFLPSVLFLIFNFELNAQTTAETLMDNYAQESANIFCNCLNNTFSSFDEMTAEGSDVKWTEIETCMGASDDDLELKYAGIENDPNYSEQMFNQLLVEKLGQMEGCELAYTIAQMGLGESTPEEKGEHK
jgi:hypothetical protein